MADEQVTADQLAVGYIAHRELTPRLYYLLDQAITGPLDKDDLNEARRLLPAGYANSFATKASHGR